MISIVICTYNRCKSLKDTLDSLLTQECNGSFDYEIVILDNNSKDKTKEIVEDFTLSFDGKLKYILETNQGLAQARNRGIKEANGDIIVFIDDDVRVTKNWLKVTREALNKFDCIGIGGKVLPVWPSKPPFWFQQEGDFKIWGGISFLDWGCDIKEFNGSVFTPMGANMAFKKKAFDRYGLFNTNLGRKGNSLIGAEEMDFCNRLIQNNEKLIYYPESIVFHLIDKRRLSLNYCRRYYFDQGRSAARLGSYSNNMKKCFNAPRYLFKMVIENIYNWVYAIIKFQDKKTILFYEFKNWRIFGEIVANFAKRN